MIKDSRPFGDFSKAGMKGFLKVAAPGYLAPSRFTFKRRINQKYKDFREASKKYYKTKRFCHHNWYVKKQTSFTFP